MTDWLDKILNSPVITIGKKEPDTRVELHQYNYYYIDQNGHKRLVHQEHHRTHGNIVRDERL